MLFWVVALCVHAPLARAQQNRELLRGHLMKRVQIEGNERTRESTVLALFPRRLPAYYTDRELDECARRLSNLEIFDKVEVARDDDVIVVKVREKWTLLPSFDFASGATLRDAYALVGVTEYNTLGTGNTLMLFVTRAQRGFGAAVAFEEHAYRRNRWAFSGDLSFTSAQYRFADKNAWTTHSYEAGVFVASPPVISPHLNMRVGLGYAREAIVKRTSDSQPLDSHAVYSALGFSWDNYTWNDLTPRGLRVNLLGGSGVLAAPGVTQPRDFIELRSEGALPLARDTVLVARTFAGVSTRGNPNYSYLIGSIEGVRGLADSFYRNWIGAYVNMELRQALRLAPRWALQGVAFCDAAGFEQMNERGTRGDRTAALSAGLGARLVPTWLASTVVRVDGARLMVPQRSWFVQFGLNQYF